MDLDGRVALVTGSRRIGGVVAEALARRGADVCVSYRRSEDEARRVVDAVVAAGRRATCRRADLSRADDCAALVRHAVADLGRLDVVVNMASRYERKAFDALGANDLQASLDVDLMSAYHCSRAAVPAMRAAGGGRIINLSDWVAASHRPRYAGYLTYYVAKSAVIALTEALALELAPDDILVNAIAPGPIVAPPDLDEVERAAVERSTPLGRWGGEVEIAKAVLAFVETDFITGETVRVDGGRHLR